MATILRNPVLREGFCQPPPSYRSHFHRVCTTKALGGNRPHFSHNGLTWSFRREEKEANVHSSAISPDYTANKFISGYYGSDEREQEGGFVFSRRASILSLVGISAMALVSDEAQAAGDVENSSSGPVSRVVRLRDVDNEEMREALRAAVAGDLNLAESRFTSLIEKYPDSASMWSNRGSVRLSMDKFEEAIGDFTEATRLAPQAPVPLFNRAIANEVKNGKLIRFAMSIMTTRRF